MQPLRLTFREKVDVCYQKTLRDKYLSEGVPAVPHLDVGRAVVRPVSRKLAEQIILKYEWLGTLPSACNYYFGVFFGVYCAGVCCVGVGAAGANLYAYKEFGLSSIKEFAYLQRGANVHWSPVGTNSKLVSWTCRLLSKQSTAKIIIAYSDLDAGEIGTIYQASNWIYIGKGSSTSQWVTPGGRVYDQKKASNLAKSNNVPRKSVSKRLYEIGWHEQKSNPKHRYVFILDKTDKELVKRVESMRKPYPKRVSGEIDNAVNSNSQTGGASPTETLTFPSLPVTRHPAGG